MKEQTKDVSTLDVEIKELINSDEFIEYMNSIFESLDDDVTFDKHLSSDTILRKALEILKAELATK